MEITITIEEYKQLIEKKTRYEIASAIVMKGSYPDRSELATALGIELPEDD